MISQIIKLDGIVFHLTTGIYLFRMIVFELFGSAESPEWAIDNTNKDNSSENAVKIDSVENNQFDSRTNIRVTKTTKKT